jgi:MinD-like ATPase involved in chromosome partitioning or flagellar assembly
VCAAFLRSNGTGEVLINKDTIQLACPDLVSVRGEAMAVVAEAAAKFGGPLLVTCSDPEGLFRLLVSPTGTVSEAPRDNPLPSFAPTQHDFAAQSGYTADAGGPAGNGSTTPGGAVPSASHAAASTTPSAAYGATAGTVAPPAQLYAPVASDPSIPAPRALVNPHMAPIGPVTTTSFIAPIPSPDADGVGPRSNGGGAVGSPRRAFAESEVEASQYAEQGWRGALARRGLPLHPSDGEMRERSYRATIAQQWTGPRTVSVVNGKGGAGKTPTTICLAAAFARFGGPGVLAWDNNQTRGTLGWRTEQNAHQATLLDLLPQIPRLLASNAGQADLANYVHHQSRDLYDVLRSKSVVLADEQRITPEDVDAIWRVAAKYYRLIIMDSGNDESDPMWRRMIDHTDQLVTVTTTRADHAEAGALLLEALFKRNQRSAFLAKNSVTIITQADPKASEESIRRIREGYSALCRDVLFIPYDPIMVEGALFYDSLKPATQRAWLAAAASVAQGL